VEAVNDLVRIPVAEVQMAIAHLFSIQASMARPFRFLVIKKPGGYGTALDACLICGADGYRQEGRTSFAGVVASAIYIPSIGQKSGCNPSVSHRMWMATRS